MVALKYEMADDASPVFNHNRDLFTKENKPIIFFLRPCPDKTKLRPLVEHGGGKLLSKFISGAVKLAQDGDHMTASEDYISTKYITDCVNQNKLVDIEDYRMKNRKSKRKLCIEDAEELSNVSDDLSPSSSVVMEARDVKGRSKYTVEEDIAMISYIVSENRQSAISGMQLYKDMVLLKVTSHSAQSMNCRFRKVVLPNVTKYDISEKWKRMFVPNYSQRNGVSGQNNRTSPYSSPRKGRESNVEVKNPVAANLSKYFGKPPDRISKVQSSDDSSFVSEDDFDHQLRNLGKNNQRALNSTPAKGKELRVDLSDSLVTINKEGNPEVLKTSDSPAGRNKCIEKHSEETRNKSKKRKSSNNITGYVREDVSSDDEDMLDSSLIRYSRKESDEFLKPKNISPIKKLNTGGNVSVIKQSKELGSPESKHGCRTRYVLDDDSDADDRSSNDEENGLSEVGRLQELIKNLGDRYGLLNEEITYLLMQHDGTVKELITFIETGKSDMTWSLQDDKYLQSNTDIEKLNSVYSKKRICQRAAFLE